MKALRLASLLRIHFKFWAEAHMVSSVAGELSWLGSAELNYGQFHARALRVGRSGPEKPPIKFKV